MSLVSIDAVFHRDKRSQHAGARLEPSGGANESKLTGTSDPSVQRNILMSRSSELT